MLAKSTMTASAVLMTLMGITLSFMPQEVWGYFGSTDPSRLNTVLIQVSGALYFAFGLTNWTAKANLIGGVYGRPIAIGNLCHFTIATLALVKAYFAAGEVALLIPTIVYFFFAIAFSIIFFTHPVKAEIKM